MLARSTEGDHDAALTGASACKPIGLQQHDLNRREPMPLWTPNDKPSNVGLLVTA